MARININLGTPPSGQDGDPVRTAFEKVNTMTTELYQGIDVANGSGWGKDKPRVFQPSDSANNLPAVSGIFLFNNGGLDLPYPYVFIEQFTSGGGWIVQKAHAINSAGTWIRKFTPGAAAGVPWHIDSIGGASIVSDPSSVNIKMQREFRDSIGIGTPYTYCKDIDAATTSEGVVLGYSYVMQDTTGNKPGGYVYGVVNTVVNANDHCHQEFVGLNAVPGVTQRAYRRSGYGPTLATRWGPWRLVIDSASATNNVKDGGVVSTTIVGGAAITRFANNFQVVSGTLGNTGVIAGTNGVYNVDIILPYDSGSDITFSGVSVNILPQQNWNFDLVAAQMVNPATLRLLVRMGGTSQGFQVVGTITGYVQV